MRLVGEQVLLRVYLQSADRPPRTPTCERLVNQARRHGLAGATVLRGLMGLNSSGQFLKRTTWGIVEHLPVIVEIVDQPARIAQFVNETLSPMISDGMLTLERAAVMMYRAGGAPLSPLQLGAPVPPLSNLPQIQKRDHMTINENGVLLRVFIGESDAYQGQPLYEMILQKVREMGLAGATVLRGVEGFGANSVVHKAGILEMSTDLPIVIEIVDQREKIEKLVPELEPMVQEGMITMEYVAIVLYRHNPAEAPPKP